MFGPTGAQRDLATAMASVRDLGDTQRYWRINAYDALWEGLIYQTQGRRSFWDTTVPLRERAPLIQSFLPRAAGRRLAGLVFGEGHFPDVTVKPRAYGLVLQPNGLAVLSQLVDEIMAAVSMPLLMQHYLINGLKSSSACAISCIRDGLPAVDLLPAKWCHPEGIKPNGSVTRLRVQYKHEVVDPSGRTQLYWYRRVLDEQGDRTWPMLPVEGGKEPDWDRIPCAEVKPLPFVPVRWTRNLHDPAACDIDGQALFAGLEDEVEALDLALSQLYRYAQYNGDPILARIGVTDDDGPSGPVGRTSQGTENRFSWLNSAATALKGWSTGQGEPAQKRGPGNLWSLPKESDLKMVESSGSGATIFAEAVRQIRRHVLDAVGVVMADADSLGGSDLSARALSLLHAPTIALAGQLRVEYGHALTGILDDLLRLCATEAIAGEGVLLQSADEAYPVLRQFFRTTTAGQPRWLGVPLDLNWGEYFEPSWQDIGAAVDAAQKANGGRAVLSLKSSVEMLAPLLGIADSDAEVASIEGDEGNARAGTQAMLGALGNSPEAQKPNPGTEHPAFKAQQEKLKGDAVPSDAADDSE